MKKTILIPTVFLLLLTFKGIGQDNVIRFGGSLDSIIIDKNIDTSDFIEYNGLTHFYYEPCLKMSEFINFWQVYKQECYNDSTVSYYWLYSDMGSYWKVPCSKGEKNGIEYDCPEHIEHKQPTAEGFLNWLLNNYQK